MKRAMGASYGQAVRRTVLPEWLSMNALMGAMLPVMAILMARNPTAVRPGGLRFCGVMSLAILAGAIVAYPVNVWLVANGLKHGMGTSHVLGRGGAMRGEHSVPQRPGRMATAVVAIATVLVLAGGVAAAARWGTL